MSSFNCWLCLDGKGYQPTPLYLQLLDWEWEAIIPSLCSSKVQVRKDEIEPEKGKDRCC